MRSPTAAAIVAGLMLSLVATPALAQTSGRAAAPGCRNAPAASAACGLRAYERWQDGSAASAPAESAAALGSSGGYRSPGYFHGGYGRFYGFGR
jgi:hypothetical protein